MTTPFPIQQATKVILVTGRSIVLSFVVRKTNYFLNAISSVLEKSQNSHNQIRMFHGE